MNNIRAVHTISKLTPYIIVGDDADSIPQVLAEVVKKTNTYSLEIKDGLSVSDLREIRIIYSGIDILNETLSG